MRIKIRRPWDVDITKYGLKEFGTKQDSYSIVEINTIEDLLELSDKISNPIIIEPNSDGYELLIYDTWIE